jgi:arylsulfatase A-like enzyme
MGNPDNVSLSSNANRFLAFTAVATSTLFAKPNIVIIYADDVGYGDVNCYGSGIVPTPRIDSLAADGIRFTDAHSPASTCTPSRYSLLTGQYAWRTPGTGIADGNSPLLIKPGTVTLPSMLRQAGYSTAVIGKWHLGMGTGTTNFNANPIIPTPLEIGFDRFYGIPATNDRVPCVYMDDRRVANLNPADPLVVSFSGIVGDDPTGSSHPNLLKYYTADAQHNNTIINGISRIGWMDGGVAARWRDEDHADIFVEKARDFIESNAASDKPFFLFFTSPDIHVPRAPHERFQGQSPHGWRGDAILQLDWSVGAVLDRLKDPNSDGNMADSIVNNTLVIFTSDNGPVGNDGYNDGSQTRATTEFSDGHDCNGVFTGGKYSLREGGTRVPFLVRWPTTIPAGSTSAALISATDFMATFAALTGQPLPTDTAPDSENVLPALLGQSGSARRVLISQNNNQNPKGVRRDQWKLHSNTSALYRLDNDPAESSDIGASNSTIRSELQAILAESEATPMLTPLTGWWPFDDGAGNNARDLATPSRSASLDGNPSWSTDSASPHFHFDGSNDAAQAGGLPALGGDFTVSAWARSAAGTWASSGALVSRRPAFAFVPVGGTAQLKFIVYAGPATPQTLGFDLATLPGFDLTSWHHYAGGYDASSGRAAIFIDGVERASASFTPGPPNSVTSPVTLGADGGSFFAGDLSDIRIYSGLLSPQRIANTASARLDDADSDGMLSDWEHRHGLDPFNPADAASDLDSDGVPNLDEFSNNTSPVVANTTGGGLQGYWKLDEDSGNTALDSSGNERHGTLINAPVRATGPGRRFLSLNGTNQAVEVSGLPDLRTQVTAACWARSNSSNWNIAGTLVSRRPQFVLHPWLNSTRLSFIVFKGGSQINAEVTLSTIPGFSLTDWHHYAGTYDSATGVVRLYVDGIPRATQTTSPGLLDSNTGLLGLGRDVNTTSARHLAGAIDAAKIYNRALSPQEVIELAGGYDDDQDGLDDAFERQLIETSPDYATLADVLPTADPDGDGSDNRAEFAAGTEPLDSSDFLRISTFQMSANEGSVSFAVNVAGRIGRSYALEESLNLNGPWETVATSAILTEDEPVSLTRFDPPPVRAFYRVRAALMP